MQLEGVLSTSQAAKSFIGTGFDVLVIFSDLFFSVIVTAQFSQHSTNVDHLWHHYLTIKHYTTFIFVKQYGSEAEYDTKQQCSGIFMARLTENAKRQPSQRANRGVRYV